MTDIPSSTTIPIRVDAIDILRAFTMLLMIFVNDLWSLEGIPIWLEHVKRGVDGMGLADTVFPAFLFIVGLSLPFSIEARRKKGGSDWGLVRHVLSKTLALIVMGVFLVNGETINAQATGIARTVWNPLCCLSFILIWNQYSKTTNPLLINGLRGIGIATLFVLAFIYRGGPDDAIQRFAQHWWGILGLIGWSYLAVGLITIFAKKNFYVIVGAWIFLAVLSMLHHAKMIPSFLSFIPEPIRGGTLAGLTMGGVMTSYIFRYFKERSDPKRLMIALLSFAILCILLTYITRPYWGIAKLGATPAWLFICSAFTLLAFIGIYWIADVYGKAGWFSIIKPAGTDTLLCYLIPYFAYAITRTLGIHLPEVVLVGGIGLIKSIVFALLCVFITRGLNGLGIRLKL